MCWVTTLQNIQSQQMFFQNRYRVTQVEDQLNKVFECHDQYLSWLSIKKVIHCHSTGVSPVFPCMWEAAGYLVVHSELVIAVVLTFPETLTSHPRTKRSEHSPVSQITPLQPTSHSQEPSPWIPLLHFPWTQVQAVERGGRNPCPLSGEQCLQQSSEGKEGQEGWPGCLLLMAPSALGYFKDCFGICLLASTTTITTK